VTSNIWQSGNASNRMRRGLDIAHRLAPSIDVPKVNVRSFSARRLTQVLQRLGSIASFARPRRIGCFTCRSRLHLYVAASVRASRRKQPLSWRKLGPRNLKNIEKPVDVYAVDVSEIAGVLSTRQQIGYCRARDGVRIAYAKAGRGPPLVKTGNWLNHLEYDWESPVWRHLLHGLAKDHTLVRYDARGNGLSDWEVDELSLDAWVADLEAVVDAAAVERFPLLGISAGCAVSIAYAVRHPERVSHLILYGGYAAGLSSDPSEVRNK
jgi:hypothetical protein